VVFDQEKGRSKLFELSVVEGKTRQMINVATTSVVKSGFVVSMDQRAVPEMPRISINENARKGMFSAAGAAIISHH
jgi:hypothetical protein